MANKKTGLIYNKSIMGNKPSWLFDSSSIETFGSSWSGFGYEIIYRVEEPHAIERVVNELKKAFTVSFGLTPEHYSFEPTFWRVYWDRGQWRASLLKECEAGLDKVAKDNNLAFMLNDVIIQPRPIGYIDLMVKSNTII
jgi:hypothetical protein